MGFSTRFAPSQPSASSFNQINIKVVILHFSTWHAPLFIHLCAHELEGCAATATETTEVPARNVCRMMVASIGSGLAEIVEYRRIGRR